MVGDGGTHSHQTTFHVNGRAFSTRTSAFDANVLQAESIAQSAERGGLKVAQVEWAGGRNATIQGPTIDFQSFFIDTTVQPFDVASVHPLSNRWSLSARS